MMKRPFLVQNPNHATYSEAPPLANYLTGNDPARTPSQFTQEAPARIKNVRGAPLGCVRRRSHFTTGRQLARARSPPPFFNAFHVIIEEFGFVLPKGCDQQNYKLLIQLLQSNRPSACRIEGSNGRLSPG